MLDPMTLMEVRARRGGGVDDAIAECVFWIGLDLGVERVGVIGAMIGFGGYSEYV